MHISTREVNMKNYSLIDDGSAILLSMSLLVIIQPLILGFAVAISTFLGLEIKKYFIK